MLLLTGEDDFNALAVLFVVRADGRLVPVTERGRPGPERGDTLVLLGPARRAPERPMHRQHP